MSKQPLGKTLLRNVIRHTDAHNKIQEEMEMWKMRDWEVQRSRHKHFPDTDSVRGRMHCDRVPDLSRNTSRSRERVLEHNDREARYWTRKLYEFEAGDPDRWGHSGFKELYPEEFESDNEKRAAKKIGHKMKKSKSDAEARLLKRSKKSSRRKKKKKKSGNEKKKKDESSSSDCSTDGRSDVKDRQKKKTRTKSRHKNKKMVKSRERNEDSSSGDGSDEEKDERRTKSRKKRKQDTLKDSDLELDSKKQRRNNWKAAGTESSDNSCTDWDRCEQMHS